MGPVIPLEDDLGSRDGVIYIYRRNRNAYQAVINVGKSNIYIYIYNRNSMINYYGPIKEY